VCGSITEKPPAASLTAAFEPASTNWLVYP
jgi:hypothetical protein